MPNYFTLEEITPSEASLQYIRQFARTYKPGSRTTAQQLAN